MAALARAPSPHLEELKFLRCGLGDRSLALLSGMDAPRLNRLSFASEGFGADGIERLFSAPWYRHLARLDLTDLGQPLTPRTVRAVTHAPRLGGLRSLGLSHNRLGAEGVGVLSGSPSLGGIRRLELSDTDGGPRDSSPCSTAPP